MKASTRRERKTIRELQDEFRRLTGNPWEHNETWWIPEGVTYPIIRMGAVGLANDGPMPATLEDMRALVLAPKNLARVMGCLDDVARIAAMARVPSISMDAIMAKTTPLGWSIPRALPIMDTDYIREKQFKRKSRRNLRPVAPMRERLRIRIERLVGTAKKGLYRVASSRWAPVRHSSSVAVGDDVGCSGGVDGIVWSKNGKWSGRNSIHSVTVPWTWLGDVFMRGIAVVEGCLTLAAKPVPGMECAYLAQWARPGRGFELVATKGYIIKTETGFVHARCLPRMRRGK